MDSSESSARGIARTKLAPGSVINHYSIVSKVGAGGMGEVYRAIDTRLGRDVAIKVLPTHLADSPDIRARFQREAQTVSQLNHPNICTLFDIGQSDGLEYLVFEYIEGETLADRITRERFSAQEILAVALQIVDALIRAHEEGVIHRDLKPGNVMLSDSGIKLLDFGLARPIEVPSAAPASDETKVAVKPLTVHGAIVGTLQYMAPEQLDGRQVDERTDIFALGCVLYEMATGRRLFDGPDSPSILSSILKFDQRAITDLSASVSEPLERIIRRCIESDPKMRYQNAKELQQELLKQRSWVADVAIPELLSKLDTIQSLDEGPEAWQAFLLAREIDKFEPTNSRLETMWPEFSRKISIITDPPGAMVSAKVYDASMNTSIEFGRTPLTGIRFPRGITQVRIELDGYRAINDVYWVFELGGFGATGKTEDGLPEWRHKLHRHDEIPEAMEYVPAGQFNLFMPGLDHLAAEATAAFLMDRHPVTNRMYRAFVAGGGYTKREYWQQQFILDGKELTWEEAVRLFTDAIGQPGPANWEMGEYPQGEDDYPVTGISWFEAAAYAAWAGKELPTIFHWNRVAFTVASSHIIPAANFSGKGLLPAGSTQSINRFGVYDLGGNVREWTWNDCGRNNERFILGGAWNDPEYAFTDAFAQSPFNRSASNGFRCIRCIEQEPNEQNLRRRIELPFRDFRNEKPVSDEVFSFFLRQFQFDKTPLNAVIEVEESSNVGIRQTIRFPAAYGNEEMIAYLYLPPNPRPPLQTVVLFPGSLAIHASSIGPMEMRRADFIMKSGRALLLPIYKGTYQRGDDLKSDYPEETAFYRDHVIMWGKDLARSIDYLETRSDIDCSELAYYGVSWGGAMGAIMPAVEKRIKAVVLYVAGLTFQRALPEVDQLNYVSRVTQPTLMLNGELDFYFPVETSQKAMFELLGTPPEHKRRITYPLGHSVPRPELIKETLAWLDKYLGPV